MPVLVCSGCCNKILLTTLGSLHPIETYFSQFCKLRSPKTKVPSDSVSGEDMILNYRWLSFHCVFMAEGGIKLSGVGFCKVTKLIHEGLALMTQSLP